MSVEEQLWRTADRGRWFIIPDDAAGRDGPLVLRSVAGDEAGFDADVILRYEVTEEEGRAWAQEEFGLLLEDLRFRIDVKLAAARAALDTARHEPVAPDRPLTADAVPALFALLGRLPRAVLDGLSGEPARVIAANGALAEVQQRLNAAGIDIDDRLANFPYRLAGLRGDCERRGKPGDGEL